MNKIESFGFFKLRSNDHFQFMTDFDALIVKYTSGVLGVDSLYTAFKAAFKDEDSAMRVELGSSKSKAIEDLDLKRDNTWNAVNILIKAYLLSPIDAEVQSAQTLKRVVDLYDDPRAFSYNEESAAIANMVTDLLLPVNASHIEKLRLLEWVNILKSQNEQFAVLFNERNAEYADRTSGDTRAARKVVDPLYAQIVDKINAAVTLDQAKPEVAKFISELNEKIKYYKTTLATRFGRSKETEATAPKA